MKKVVKPTYEVKESTGWNNGLVLVKKTKNPNYSKSVHLSREFHEDEIEEAEIISSEINNTCSMNELTDFPSSTINIMIEKAGIKKVKSAFDDYMSENHNKSVLYNTNSKPKSVEHRVLGQLGFTKVFQYKGAHTTVYTFMREN